MSEGPVPATNASPIGSTSITQTGAGSPSQFKDSHSAGSGGSGAQTTAAGGKSRKKQQPQGSYLDRVPGVRQMKEYPITESEMTELGGLGAATTIFFSFGSGILGFLIDVQKDLSLAQDAPEKAVAFWSGAWWVAAFAALILFAFGGAAIWRGTSRIQQIKGETQHRRAEE